MSMIHTAYLHDFDGYYGEIFACDIPLSNELSDWQLPVTRMRNRLRSFNKGSIPTWQVELLEEDLKLNLEEIGSNAPIQSMRVVRNLNYLSLLSYTLHEGHDYYKFWDILRKGLDGVLGEEYGCELVLGVYWKGAAWDFASDLVSYQFGVVLPEKISRFAEIIEAINSSVFATTLKTLNWRDIYSVYNDTISDEEIDDALQALSGLKNNLEQAKECNCGILYLLN